MNTTQDIKIPYAKEGVIRTAQIDDTISPTDSVQLAVNMNFDRVGALQTRPGVTQYATSEGSKIKNFGVLNNELIVPGFDRLFKLAPTLNFSGPTEGRIMSAVKVDDTHILVFWSGVTTHGFAQVFSANQTTGVMVAIGSPLTFEGSQNLFNAAIQVDSTHYLNLWGSTSAGVGQAQVFAVSGSFAVTAVGSPFTFDATAALSIGLAQINSTHFITFYAGASGVGKAVVLAVDGSFAVTAPGATFTFDASQGLFNQTLALGDGLHFINFWNSTSNDGKVQTFLVNTGTWAITAVGSPLTFDSTNAQSFAAASLADSQHFILFWNSVGVGGLAQVFNVAPSTFAVTAIGTALTFTSQTFAGPSTVSMGDGIHFVTFWQGNSQKGYGQIFNVNLSTFVVSYTSLAESIGDTGNGGYNSVVLGSAYHVVNFWSATGSPGTGEASVFKMEAIPTAQNILFAQKANGDVDIWNGATWVNVRTNLRTGGKARFSQYLNYLWMVNGNTAIGNPVATSNGSTFGTTLVPVGFPPGDFIHAGFEGRIWVLDATYGIIYYSDIVQFTPPDVYTITYDPDVNFIKDIAPQNGQKFTGVFEVPRALLIFTQDSIFRIYGATSIDAYPAYNVGTYSQESIVETKTGIFFHHSSGFYQFDYGSQPVEISRRIIDFIKAIPRTQYPDIVGVYDGFDAIEWAVGTVTVEGVTFTNCVCRYTISTQVWTIYDYVGNVITAMISFDDGTSLYHLLGTLAGKVGAMDTGTTDFGEPFYFEYIDRWRSFTDMYAKIKSISGVNVYSENAAGASLLYQVQKDPPNVWTPIDTVDQENNSLFPNSGTDDFDVMRFRLVGTSKGTSVVVHGIEILSLTDKGYNEN